jgi:photosystem II stability/assembly factor-like uncharacterized protein
MRLNLRVWTPLALVLFLAVSVHARSDEVRVREAGPEDASLNLVPFLFHDDEVLADGGRAGIFASDNRGERWERRMNGMVGPDGVEGFVDYVCQAQSAPRTVYALVFTFSFGELLFSTEDFGRTWTRRASVATQSHPICTVDPDDRRAVFVVDTTVPQVWKSTDGARSIQIVTNLPSCYSVEDDLFNLAIFPRPGILYVDSGGRCKFASTDGGRSFQVLAEPPAFASFLTVSPDGRTLLFSTVDALFRPSGTFRSTDRGATFVAVRGLDSNPPFAFDPVNPSRIYAVNSLLYASTDGGLSFALVPASNDPRFVAGVLSIDVDQRGSVYLNTFGGPFRSDDRGGTFRSLLDGFRASAVNDLAFDADGRLLVGSQNTQAIFRQAHGLSYNPITTTLPRVFDSFATAAISVAASPTDPDVVLAATLDFGIIRTEDGGRSWTPALGVPPRLPASRMAFPTSSRVYLAFPTTRSSAGPGLYRSDDEGRSFARVSSLPLGAIGVAPTDPDVLYAGTFNGNAGLFKSTDGGQTLQDLGRPGTFSAIVVDREHPEVVYAGERFGQLIRSLDGGRTFAPASIGLTGAGVHGLAQDSRGTLFVWIFGGGLFASRDGASTWRAVDTSEAMRRSGIVLGRGSLVVDPRHPGRVYLGNAGVIQIDSEEDDRDD